MALGYTNPQKAIRDHVDDDDKLTERFVLSGQIRSVVIINESGLYSLVLSSKFAEPRGQDAACHPAQLSGEQHRESGKNNQHCADRIVRIETNKLTN